jgi:ABC-type branched-subunit amino acid transport system ATPase component
MMGIQSTFEYVDFFTNLNMGENVSLLSFVNNEKIVLKQKLEYKNLEKEPIQKGVKILEELVKEINEIGEKAVLEKYQK